MLTVRRRRPVLLALALCLVAALATTMPIAQADSGTVGGGTAVTATLTSPADGSSYVAGSPLPVSGTVALGQGAAVKDTDLVFVLDTSGSTDDPALSCGTVLSCEKVTTQSVIASFNNTRSPIANVGVVAFPGTQTVPLVAPAAFNNDLSTFTSSGGTQFDVGISRARDMLATGPSSKHVMVLVTDGDGTTQPVSGVGNIVIKTFAIAGAGCSANLQTALSQGAAGSSCQVVSSLDALPSLVGDTIDSSLNSVDITVNGTVVQTLPVTANGQSTTPFSTTLTGLTAGNGQPVCAVAHATDAGGMGTVSDCNTINVLPPGTTVINCPGTTACTGTSTDPGKSTVRFDAPAGFNETVALSPTAGTASDCGGSVCRTGYNVAFPTTGGNGPVVSLTTTTVAKISVQDRVKAGIFIDGKRITAQCNNRSLIAAIRNLLGIPEPIPCLTITYNPNLTLQYFVKFKGDPKVTFR
jgi:hypothetical protein